MPHKHKRDRITDKDQFNLPPDTIAKPLSVSKVKPTNGNPTKPSEDPKRNLKRKRGKPDPKDDTPRAFARLIAFQNGIKPRSGLDNGVRKSKKQKKNSEAIETTTNPTASAVEIPRILPGERMNDYSARVDAALPISGLITKGTRNVPGVKRQQTKTEKKMHRIQKEWREIDARYKEKLQEALEEAEDDEDEGTAAPAFPLTKSKKKAKRKNGPDSDDEDPWAGLTKARKEQAASAGLVGLHDVVLAPPQFTRAPKQKFKVQAGAGVDVLNVPGVAGSLRRREELGEARRSVVNGYRQMMKERNGVVRS